MATSALGQQIGEDESYQTGLLPAGGQLDTTLSIETPERVVFSYQLAGPAVRTAAYLLDLLARGAIVLVVLIVVSMGAIAVGRLQGLETGLTLVLFFTLEWGYFVLFDALMGGSSPGKRAFGLRVIHDSGRPLTASESILRNLLRAADILPFFYAIGLSTMCFDRSFRRLGDLVAGTVVVREGRTKLRKRKAPLTHQDVAGLPRRPALTRQEFAALSLFERRSAELGRSRAEELAEIAAPGLRARYGVRSNSAVDLLLSLRKRAAQP